MNAVHASTEYCFSAISQIRQLEPSALPSPEVLQQRLSGYIEQMQVKLRHAGLSSQDIDDITYAIVALADEVALNAGEMMSSYWMTNLLQYKYFHETTAGDGFFARLELIKRDPQRREVLKIYGLCLLFGFQGKYRVRGGELELMTLTESLHRESVRPRGDVEILSPRGHRPTEVIGGVKPSAPILFVSAGVLAVAVILYGSLRLLVSSSADSVVDQVAVSQPKGS